MNEEKERYSILINFLQNDSANHLNWAQKKEIAAWLATIFYIGILTTLINLILTSDNLLSSILVFFILSISICILFISVSYFIYSNFSSIYNSNAYYLAIKIIIFNILEDGIFPNLLITDPKMHVHPDVIEEELERRRESISPKKNRSNPFKLVFKFWTNVILCRSQTNNLGSNHIIQESAIFSLLIISTILFYCILINTKWSIIL